MSTKQRPPLTPHHSEYLGLARIAGAEAAPVEARHLLRWPSRSRPGKEHHSSCDERGGDVRCTCEAWTYRGACGHAAGHLDALAHHGVTFGPPADPGGAVGGPPELAGLTECEDAARDERKRRHAEAMRDLYGDLARDEATLRRGYPSDEVERILGAS